MTERGQTNVGELSRELLSMLKGDFDPYEGLDPQAIEAKKRADDERRRKQQRSEIVRMALANVPPKTRAFVCSGDVENDAVVLAVQAWARNTKAPRVLVLRGGVGVGKSVAAALAMQTVAAELDHRGYSWHRPDEFISAVLHSYDERSPVLGGDLVVLDDMGTEKRSEELSDAICTFIDTVSARLIITTNLKKTNADPLKPGFREKYADVRLLDRLREVGESRRSQAGDF
jgi:DNA replication protein DnaC